MPFGSLWLPVVLSAIAVFVASSIMHMVLKYHKADIRKLPGEDAVLEALAKTRPAPGLYFAPHCADHKQMNEPAMKAKLEKGPVAMITVFPNGTANMPKLLSLWLLFSLLVSFVAAYVARNTLHPGSDGMLVMRITCTVAFAGYALAQISDSIWKGQPWGNTCRGIIDSAIYATLTGLVFYQFWPAAV